MATVVHKQSGQKVTVPQAIADQLLASGSHIATSMPGSIPYGGSGSGGAPPNKPLGSSSGAQGALDGLVVPPPTAPTGAVPGEGPPPNPAYRPPSTNPNATSPTGTGANAQSAIDAALPDGGAGPDDQVFPQGPTVPARDFFAEARLLYPWLPDELLQIFASAWESTGDPALALATMRQSPAYDNHFAGNRRDDGTYRLTEQEYLSTLDGFRQILADYGQPASVFSDRFVNLIQGDVSVREFQERLDLSWNEIAQKIPEIRQAYAQHNGLSPNDPQLSDQVLFGSFLDPSQSLQQLRVKVANATIGGRAASYGYDRSLGRIEELRRFGVDEGTAINIYQTAQIQSPTLSAFAYRYFDPDDTFGVDDFEDAISGLDPDQRERAERLVAFERSTFTSRGQVASTSARGLSGLNQS